MDLAARDAQNCRHVNKGEKRWCRARPGCDLQGQEDFRTTKQICVATEAAGEGINLQFCRLMINYDLPWNPTRLEQRLGRIHRIGQERDVHAFNFVAAESEEGQPIIEGRILDCLLAKMEQMRAVLADRVFDVIGEVLSLNDVNLPEMLREAAHDPRRLDEYLDRIQKVDPARLMQYERATGIALARASVDFSAFERANAESEERRLMPRYVEDHFLRADPQTGYRDPVTGIRRIEVKGRRRGQTIRLTTNEWYKAVQLADSYWLYVVWDPLENAGAEPLRIQNPAKHLDYAKREVVAARYFDIPADAVERAADK